MKFAPLEGNAWLPRRLRVMIVYTMHGLLNTDYPNLEADRFGERNVAHNLLAMVLAEI